tara:strand:+ start:1175 stop:1405 length:231 start_codon:yes stop_codon:yes gene_type:complete
MASEQELENFTIDVRLLIDVPHTSHKGAIQWARNNINILLGRNLMLSENRLTSKQSHYVATIKKRGLARIKRRGTQ